MESRKNGTDVPICRAGIERQTNVLTGVWWWDKRANNGNSDRLFSWAPKSLQMLTAAMKLKDTCSLEEKL